MIEQKESIFCLVYIYTVCSFFPLWLTPISFNLSEIMITPEYLALLAMTISGHDYIWMSWHLQDTFVFIISLRGTMHLFP